MKVSITRVTAWAIPKNSPKKRASSSSSWYRVWTWLRKATVHEPGGGDADREEQEDPQREAMAGEGKDTGMTGLGIIAWSIIVRHSRQPTSPAPASRSRFSMPIQARESVSPGRPEPWPSTLRTQ